MQKLIGIEKMTNEYYSIELPRDELNRHFGGGIPKNSLILIEGKDGSGKSILCQRISYALLKKGKTVTYISTELNTLEFIRQTNSVNYCMRDFFLDGTLLFITMIPYLGRVKFENNFIEKIINSPKLFENEVIIFDTLSFLLVKENATEGDYYKIINFFKKLNNINKTVIFTIDPVHINDKFLTLLRNVSDLYINMKIESFAGQTIRVIDIKRFKRPNDIYTPRIPFRVEPKEGLIIEIGGYA